MPQYRPDDHVDRLLAQWHALEPDRDVTPMALFTRLYRLSKYLNWTVAAVFRQYGLHDGEFDLLATLYRSGERHGLTPNALRCSVPGP